MLKNVKLLVRYIQYININIYICVIINNNNNMSKKKTSWQISEATFDKVKQQATKDKVAIQVKAEQLILIALEGKSK